MKLTSSTEAQNRIKTISLHLTSSPNSGPAGGTCSVDEYKSELLKCREELCSFIDETNSHPILIRTAWHDAGTFNKQNADQWPKGGGANGSIRFEVELGHGANAGLPKGIAFLRKFKEAHPLISWADLIQLAGATAVEVAGGPLLPMRYGRADIEAASQCPPEGLLPAAAAPFPDQAPTAAAHIRNVFGRMGFNAKEIVALSGAHTVGRAFKERSGTVENGAGPKQATKFTCPMARVRKDNQEGVGMPGGKSWTSNWLTFDNSYFHKQYEKEPKELLWLETDAALHTDPDFKTYFDLYARDQDAFFRDFTDAYVKLSECGSKFIPVEGVRIDCPHKRS